MNSEQAHDPFYLYGRLLDFDEMLAREEESLEKRLTDVRKTREAASKQMQQLNQQFENPVC